jgi:hypothetical protein
MVCMKLVNLAWGHRMVHIPIHDSYMHTDNTYIIHGVQITKTDRQKDSETDRQRDRQTYEHTYIDTCMHTFIHTYVHTDRHTDI